MLFCPAPGTVYIVGTGPGAPDMLTLRAQAVIAAATLLVPADAPASATLGALGALPGAQVLDGTTLPPERLLARLAEHALAGGVAALLLGGDALRSGSAYIRLIERLGVRCDLVPGVPSAPPILAPTTTETAPVYPITLTGLRGAPVVVVGGGAVAARKVAGLLAVGAAVRLISPAATAELRALAEAGQLVWEQRPYAAGDLAGARLAFAATDQRSVNAAVAHDAAQYNILCNVADAPAEGSFHLPAVHRAPAATIAISTHGTDPAGARRLRDSLARWLAGEA